MLPHLLEEEQESLPLMRSHFTAKEFKPVEKRLIAGISPFDMAWLLRAMSDDESRRYWMTQVAGIPRLVQIIIMMPALRKFLRWVGGRGRGGERDWVGTQPKRCLEGWMVGAGVDVWGWGWDDWGRVSGVGGDYY